jgi:hypothetical protein
MNKPIPVGPPCKQPETSSSTSGEGAQTALAAMIRKRKMGENHVEHEPDARLGPVGPMEPRDA